MDMQSTFVRFGFWGGINWSVMALCGNKWNNFFGVLCRVPRQAAPQFGSLLVKELPHIPLLQSILEGATHRHALLQVAEDFDFQGK